MSPLRPIMRRPQGLLRSLRRNYATPATPSTTSTTTSKVASKAQEVGEATKTKAQEVGEAAKTKAQEVGAQAQAAAPNVAAKAQEAGSQTMAKATDALQKGMAAAGPMVSKLGQGTAAVVSKVPGGGEAVVGRVQSMIPPTVYYSKVGLELAKQVFHGQQMALPSMQSVSAVYSPYFAPLLKPNTWLSTLRSMPSNVSSTLSSLPSPTSMYQKMRTMSSKEWAHYGILGAEFLGFFTVGEMIGRRKIVGYRGGVPAHH